MKMDKKGIKANVIAVSVIVIGVIVGLAVDKMFNISSKVQNEKMRLVG